MSLEKVMKKEWIVYESARKNMNKKGCLIWGLI